jgi:hypothetical protein
MSFAPPIHDLALRSEPSGAGSSGGTSDARRHPSPVWSHLAERLEVAAAGVRGPASPLPHLDSIQRSFGHHDITGIRAHLGPQATRAARRLRASAYATGRDVAFARSPDLFTAAHEAAHVVQQAGGRGQTNDTWERHADAVAEQVVAGRSAQALLDRVATAGLSRPAATPTVQCKGEPPIPKARSIAPVVLGGVFQAYIRMGLQGQIGATKIAASNVVRVKVVSDLGFRSAWADYCERSGVPRQEPQDGLNGFVDPTHPDGQMGFVREAGGLGTIVHETMHQLSFSGFRDGYGRAMNEGATELFTRVVLANNKADIERTAYPKEYAAMLRLQGICGLTKMAEFYFGGDASGVIAAVGKGRFFQFTQAMGAQDPDTAIGVL